MRKDDYMSFNLIIGMGNTGCQIVKAAAESTLLTECKYYMIDSVTSQTDTNTISKIKTIPIVSDDKNGSGRSRERGAAMFEFHDKNDSFKELYADAKCAKSPVIVITSSSGGTGSGSTPHLCKRLIDMDIQVIPVIICPAMKDPDAFHLNTTDLMVELKTAEIETYCVFRNEYGKADYTEINNEVVTMLEIILGKRYDATDKDSIDDSDLDVILSTPGRFIAVEAEANTPSQLKRIITEKVLNGHQPAWTTTDSMNSTLMTAFSLSSPFASGDFEEVFSALNERIAHRYDEYRNICNRDGICKASIIVAGLPRAELKSIDLSFQSATGIADGISTTSSRPDFMKKKGSVRSVKPVVSVTSEETNQKLEALGKFNIHN
jgi:hypothetical protein